MQPSSLTSKQRLNEISNCTDELARLRDSYGLPDLGDRIGVTIGECDWLEELHRLLFTAIAPDPNVLSTTAERG